MDTFLNSSEEDRRYLEKLIAIALKHKRDTKNAPQIIAKGVAETAEEILKIAIESGIPIKSNAGLAKILQFLDIDDYIPFETFAAVAEILAQLYKNEKEHKINL